MTQAAVSDAVLLLSKTPCRRLIFIGAIGGLAKSLQVGDVVEASGPRPIYSVKSIHAETKKKLLQLRRKGVVGIDFESRGFFSTARKAKLSATAYYVATDLPLTKPFFAKKSKKQEHKIRSALDEIMRICSKA
jgi:purine-nucleoside phosphorylase